MTPEQFARAVRDFRKSEKKLYAWVGSEDRLRTMLSGLTVDTLNCVELIPPEQPPPKSDETSRKILEDNLERALKSRAQEAKGRTALVVREVIVLARYGARLNMFYDSGFIADERMAVLVLPELHRPTKLPGYVHAEPERVLEYFRARMEPDKLIEGG